MADKQDGALLVQLAQWSTSMGADDAMRKLYSDGFDPETATIDDPDVSKTLMFGETIGTLTKNGLIDTALVLDWLWVAGMWGRVGPAARKERDKHGDPRLFENFEALAGKDSG